MGVEIIAVVVMALVLTLVVGAVRLETQERTRGIPATTQLSAEDRRLLHLLKLTPAEWLVLTHQQRADARERACRGME